MRLLITVALASASMSPATALPLHQYSALAMSPTGDRVAAVETDEEPKQPRAVYYYNLGLQKDVYGEHFVLPEVVIDEAVATLPGLDGRKMSKSYGNTVPLFAPSKALRSAILKVKSDSTALETPVIVAPAQPVDAERRCFQIGPRREATTTRPSRGRRQEMTTTTAHRIRQAEALRRPLPC